MAYIGDFALGQTFDTKFTTRQISGAPSTLASSPVISAYVGNSTTEITAGITLSVDFDSRTGLNNVRVVATSGNGYATASDYQLVITTGTVNSVSVVGEVIAEFSIENRQSNVKFWNGTAVATPATAGIPDVNVKNINNVAAATPGASGGILIAGSNAATTIAGLTTGALACTTITASGAVAFQSTFAVTTSSAFGAMSCTTLTASGAVAFQSTFAVTTSTALAALSCTTLTASGAVALQSTLGITGAVTLSSTLATGAVTLSALTVTNNLLVSGTATITGAFTSTSASNDVRGILTQKTISAAMDELSGVPAAGPSAGAALEFIFMALRNKRDTTATTDIITNDAGGTIATATLSDDTVTFEKGEYA